MSEKTKFQIQVRSRQCNQSWQFTSNSSKFDPEGYYSLQEARNAYAAALPKLDLEEYEYCIIERVPDEIHAVEKEGV